ncbi:MAG: protein kinase [Planctomycetota bacterium]
MASSADRSTYLIVLHKRLLPQAELNALAHESQQRQLPLLRILEARLGPAELERVVKTRARHARSCQACGRPTYLLPQQTEENTPCEHCGGRLLQPGRHREPPPGFPVPGAPAHGAPVHGAPVHGAPAHGAPAHGAPVAGVPGQQPAFGAPPGQRVPQPNHPGSVGAPRPAPGASGGPFPSGPGRGPVAAPARPAAAMDGTMWEAGQAAPPRMDGTMWEAGQAAPPHMDGTMWEAGQAAPPRMDGTMWEAGQAAPPHMDGTMWEGGAPQPAGADLTSADGIWLQSQEELRRPAPRQASSLVDLPADPGTPGRLGPYRISTILGEGAMGTVYRAQREGDAHEVALKVIQGEAITHSLLERFDREATIATSLQHPAIMRVFEAGEVENVPFMACQLIERARTLTEAIKGAKARAKLEKIQLVADALGFAHERGVIHRDVKPDNVLVDLAGNPYVSDFGLANMDELEAITVAGTQLGTPAFMAPEQVTAERDQQGPHTDVWALGVILYEAVVGVRPFAGDSFSKLFRAILAAAPAPPRQVNARIPDYLERVILKCLSRDPQARYANGAALAAAIGDVLDKR